MTAPAGGVFTQNSAGTGTGTLVLVNADGSQVLVKAANPATAGCVLVIDATGLADVSPRITVTICGKAANIFFVGPDPGFNGL